MGKMYKVVLKVHDLNIGSAKFLQESLAAYLNRKEYDGLVIVEIKKEKKKKGKKNA